MKAILLREPGRFEQIGIDEPSEARTRRGAGARPPRRHLRHRHQRLPRQDAVLQLPAHPRPRAGRRGARGRPRRDATSSPATAAPSSRTSTASSCFACRRGGGNCCENLQVLGVHTDGGLRPRFLVPARKLHSVGAADARPAGPGRDARHRLPRRQPRRPARPAKTCWSSAPARSGCRVIEFVKLTGATIIVLDLNEQRLDFCKQQMGVHHTVRFGRRARSLKALQDLTDGALYPVVFDATGSPQVDVQRLQLRRPHRPAGVRRHRRQRRPRSPTRCSTAGK